MMKLGVCYNLFDGHELLEYVIDNSSKYTDFCCIVVQEVSNLGNTIDTDELYKNIKKCGKLIDKIIVYVPNLNIDPHLNELEKRNIGIRCCRQAKCTHVMTADIDEFYNPEEVKYAKDRIERDGFDGSACNMIEYYRDTNHTFKTWDAFYVSFIYKLNNRDLVFNSSFPVNVDPTRRMPCKKVCIFKRNELQLHHLTYVRKNIYDKLASSSNRKNKTEANMREVEAYYMEWDESKPAMMNGNPPSKYVLNKVDFGFLPKIDFIKADK